MATSERRGQCPGLSCKTGAAPAGAGVRGRRAGRDRDLGFPGPGGDPGGRSCRGARARAGGQVLGEREHAVRQGAAAPG